MCTCTTVEVCELWIVEWSVEYGVTIVGCGIWTDECGVWNMEKRVWRVEYGSKSVQC